MNRILRRTTGAAAIVVAGACADIGRPSADLAGAVAAFESVPGGF